MALMLTRDKTDRRPLGSVVYWDSHGGSRQTTKKGTIVAVVEPGQRADLVARSLSAARQESGQPRYRKMFGVCSYLRDSVSYLVEVPHPGKGMPLLYWPRTENLTEPED